MRKLLGKDHPYVTVEDFAGAVVGLQASGVAEQTFTALGATTTRLPSGADISEVDGYEQQLASIWGNHYELEADFVTANVNLWPRPLVIVADTDVFESLDPDQQDVLRDATANVIPAALEASRGEDASGGDGLCRAGMTFATASAGQLDTLRAALTPVYASLGEDPGTAEFLEAINELKQHVGAPPDAAKCTPTSVSDEAKAPSAASALDGTYTATLTGAEISASGCNTPNFAQWHDPDDEIAFELTLSEGRLELLESVNGGEVEEGFIGTYNVFRDQIELQDGPVQLIAHWTLDGTNLVFNDIENGSCDDEVVWTTHPWVLVEAAEPPSTEPAPAAVDESSIPNGTYTTTVTREEALETCPDLGPDEFPADESTYELTLDNGFVTLMHESGDERDVTLTGSYTVFRDRFTFDADTDPDTFTAQWAIDRNALHLHQHGRTILRVRGGVDDPPVRAGRRRRTGRHRIDDGRHHRLTFKIVVPQVPSRTGRFGAGRLGTSRVARPFHPATAARCASDRSGLSPWRYGPKCSARGVLAPVVMHADIARTRSSSCANPRCRPPIDGRSGASRATGHTSPAHDRERPRPAHGGEGDRRRDRRLWGGRPREFPGSAPTALGRSAGIIGGSASVMEPALEDAMARVIPRGLRTCLRVCALSDP